jgi:hypothetical protein
MSGFVEPKKKLAMSIIGDEFKEEDERHAWDTYCAFSPYSDPKLQAQHADKLLEERRKRWGGV